MYLSTDLSKEWVRMSGYLISLHVVMCMTTFLCNELFLVSSKCSIW